jgi:hypothetical protein
MKKSFILFLIGAVCLGAVTGQWLAKKRATGYSQRVMRAARPAEATHAAPSETVSTAPNWMALEAGDFPQFLNRLRAAGCPEETIRDIALMHVAREFYARVNALEDSRHNAVEWWHGGNKQADYAAYLQQNRHLRRAMNDRLYELLGVSAQDIQPEYLGWGESGQRNAWLAFDKRQAFDAMLDRFQDEKDGVSAVQLRLNEDQKAALAVIGKRQRAELEAFLSPTELEAYDLRNSAAAKYVLDQLPPAQNENEYKVMVKIAQQKGAKPKPIINELDVDIQAANKAAEAQKTEILAAIKTALGPMAAEAQQQAADQIQAAKDEAKHAQDETDFSTTMAGMALSVGADNETAQRMAARMKSVREQLMAQFPNSDVKEEDMPKLKEQVLKIIETNAVEIMGEKGRDFTKKLSENKSS